MLRCIPMLSVVGRRCPAAENHGGAAAPPYLVIYRQLVDALTMLPNDAICDDPQTVMVRDPQPI